MCVDKRRNKIAKAILLGTAGVMAAGLLAAQLSAQSFSISQNGKSVGTSTLSINKAAAGFAVSAQSHIDMPGLKYNFTETASLDGGFHLAKVQLNGDVNGTKATVDAGPQGQQYQMTLNANGQVINTPLAFHPQGVFFPDFDPAALQTVLNLGAAHNNRSGMERRRLRHGPPGIQADTSGTAANCATRSSAATRRPDHPRPNCPSQANRPSSATAVNLPGLRRPWPPQRPRPRPTGS
jgi:hypothetical protein